MKKILIVEDDLLIAELERDYLAVANYEVTIEPDGKNGLTLAMNGGYDLLLLDVMLPSLNGFEICRAVRRVSNVPIILVTAKQEDLDIVRGMGLGADDYITKPFSPMQLVARIKAHIAMHERLTSTAQNNENVLSFGELNIDTAKRLVRVGEKIISLKNKEFEILMYLAENPGIVLTKEQIYERVWGLDAVGDTATVTVHINRIREKIESDPSNPIYVLTEWGVGYRFCMQSV